MIQRRYRWIRPAISSKLAINLTGAAMLCIASLSFADRQPGSLSTIKINPSSVNVEIIHRLHNHDAELGIIAALGDRTLTLDRLTGQAQLALYVEERFLVAETDGENIGAPLELQLIGAEVDGEFVLVYQEFTDELPERFALRNDILRDVFPEQINHVNIAVSGEVDSLIFQGDDDWQHAGSE